MTEHNLYFYQRVMQGLRDAIAERRLRAFATLFLDRYRAPAKAGARTGEAV
jgi:queuine tRNA-ribosyltransferase